MAWWNNRERITKLVAALPVGTEFSARDILHKFPMSSRDTPPMRSVVAVLNSLDMVECLGSPPNHAPATWRRI